MLRRMGTIIGLAGLVVSALALVSTTMADAAELLPAEARGKLIYQQGETESGRPVTVLLGRGAGELPASVVPCGGCHGEDGLGRPEGGIVPPDITWPALTGAYGHDHEYGRSHPAFDEVTFGNSLVDGIDPGGNEFDRTMPRYRMSDADLADLIAYIKVIDRDFDAGISDDAIRIGTLLPTEGRRAPLGAAMRDVLEAYFADVNAEGGINGRKLELVVAGYGDDSTRAVWRLRDLVREKAVFALVSGYVDGLERAVAELSEAEGIPLVGPMTRLPARDVGLNHFSFYLLSGLHQQAAVLVQHADRVAGERSARTAIVSSGVVPFAEFADATAAAAERWPLVERFDYDPAEFDPAALASQLALAATESVFFYGSPDEFSRFAAAADRSGFTPTLYTPGGLAARTMFDIPPSFAGKAFIAYPTVPDDHSPGGVAAFESLHQRHGLDYMHSNAQLSAYGAAMILAEGLKRSGRGLSRERFVAELEGLTDFRTGLTPPISYNPTRRIGALGGYVLALDPADRRLSPTGSFINLEPQPDR